MILTGMNLNNSRLNFSLKFMVKEQQLTILDLFSKPGRMIRNLLDEIKTPGVYENEIDPGDLLAGVYFCT